MRKVVSDENGPERHRDGFHAVRRVLVVHQITAQLPGIRQFPDRTQTCTNIYKEIYRNVLRWQQIYRSFSTPGKKLTGPTKYSNS